MKKVALCMILGAISYNLSGCSPEPAQYTAQPVEPQKIDAPIKTSVTDLSLERNPSTSFNCALDPAVVSQLSQAIAQKNVNGLKGVSLQSTSSEYLMAVELITGKASQVSFYDRQKFNSCVMGQ